MGQNATRPVNLAGEAGSSRGGHSGQGSSGSASGSRDRSSASSGPASVAHLPPVIVDGGHTIPQGVYPGAPQDFHHQIVRSLIIARKLCPFYPTVDDDDEGQAGNGDFATEEDTVGRPATECPICFLTFPASLNRTRCCGQPICTECFVQIKRADPNHTNPPSSEPASCPYCMTNEFGVVYSPRSKQSLPTSPSSPGSSGIQGFSGTEGAAGLAELAAGGSRVPTRRRSAKATDADVVTVDMVRPDWEEKLQSALAAIARRANRRIIMRQVGDRLIPIGVSSSRMGAELPVGDGPGGTIILREGENWGQQAGTPGTERSSRRRRGPFGLPGDGPDMEELMMAEAMRLSLLEHEEQQRRQAAASVASTSAAPASAPAASTAFSNTSERTASALPALPNSASVLHTDSPPRTQTASSSSTPATIPARSRAAGGSSFSEDAMPSPGPATRVTSSSSPLSTSAALSTSTSRPVDFGLTPGMMAELSELVEAPLSGVVTHTHAEGSLQRAAPMAAAARNAAHSRNSSAISAPGSQPGSYGANSAGSTPVHGSPSRPLNPNNPFRQAHSRAASANPAQGSPR
ncbi:Putative Zn-finger protein [Ceraceosorus bombacis]|uniref:Putative Zn-finger protein n=1 Tax=Ceraceosorus bombacis TaxID=401625 RepID=A0A0P1BCT1_9BASI|nr:Putative Zn-finger protein [Ceraceosorus bombacis]